MIVVSATRKKTSLQDAAGIFYDVTATTTRGWEKEGALSLQKIYLVRNPMEQNQESIGDSRGVSKEGREAVFGYLRAVDCATVCCVGKPSPPASDWLEAVKHGFSAVDSDPDFETHGFRGLAQWLNRNPEQNPLVIAPADWLRTFIVAALEMGEGAVQRFALDGGRITILQYAHGRFFLETLNMKPGGTGRE